MATEAVRSFIAHHHDHASEFARIAHFGRDVFPFCPFAGITHADPSVRSFSERRRKGEGLFRRVFGLEVVRGREAKAELAARITPRINRDALLCERCSKATKVIGFFSGVRRKPERDSLLMI